MNCMRCGVEIPADQVFCPECLEDMERHPVAPGTPLVLPKREHQTAAGRPSRRKNVKPEERIASLRKTLLVMAVTILLLIAALGFTITMLLNVAAGKEVPFLPGQNYSTNADTNPGAN